MSNVPTPTPGDADRVVPRPRDTKEVVAAPRDPERATTPPHKPPLGEQPRWRRDFPIDWSQDEYVSRRDLVQFLVLTSLAFVTGQFWLVGQKVLGMGDQTASAVPIADLDELPVGGSKVFHYPPEVEAPRLLIRTGENRFLAYDQQCTHLLCPVVPEVEEGVLHCPCHEGYFDLETGSVLSGPPRRPLPKVALDIRDGSVYAVGIEEPLA